MSKPAPIKYFASLSIEEQLPFPRHQQQQSWLLTYVDVFILIIMLVITLIALSDFKSEIEQQRETTQVQKKQKKTEKISPALQQTSASIPADIKQIIQPAPAIEKTTQAPQQTSIQELATEQPEPEVQEKTPLITDQPTEVASAESVPPEETDENKQLQDFKNSLTELGLIDSVNMTVILGYAQLEIQDKILFKSSEAVLVNAGENLLKKISLLLKQSTGLIYIEGHTDNRPIKTAKFPSNWELGAARATSVLHYLSSQNLDASRLRAITYGSTKPIADNATKEGREKNRRVSLIIKVSDKID